MIYLVVPGYLLYKLLAWMWSWFDKSGEQEAEEVLDPKAAKKMEKLKKKEEKPKVKFVKS